MTRPVKAKDLLAELQANPRHVTAKAHEAELRLREEVRLQRAEAPLVRELREGGVPIASAWDLVGRGAPSSTAVAILARHLQRPYPAAVRHGIARALAHPAARPHWPAIAQAYRTETESEVRQGLADAISAIADDSTFDELVALAGDAGLGESRLLLLEAFPRFGERGRQALAALHSDPTLRREVVRMLSQLGRGNRDVVAHQGWRSPSLEEAASISLSSSSVRPFLVQLDKLGIGVNESLLERVTNLVSSLKVGESDGLDFQWERRGKSHPFRLEVFVDDTDTCDLYLLVPRALKDEIEQFVNGFEPDAIAKDDGL